MSSRTKDDSQNDSHEKAKLMSKQNDKNLQITSKSPVDTQLEDLN